MNSKDIKYLDWITLAIVALAVIATDAPIDQPQPETATISQANQ